MTSEHEQQRKMSATKRAQSGICRDVQSSYDNIPARSTQSNKRGRLCVMASVSDVVSGLWLWLWLHLSLQPTAPERIANFKNWLVTCIAIGMLNLL
jgi:hypothetical protein